MSLASQVPCSPDVVGRGGVAKKQAPDETVPLAISIRRPHLEADTSDFSYGQPVQHAPSGSWCLPMVQLWRQAKAGRQRQHRDWRVCERAADERELEQDRWWFPVGPQASNGRNHRRDEQHGRDRRAV